MPVQKWSDKRDKNFRRTWGFNKSATSADLSSKAPVASPAFTGPVTGTGAATFTNIYAGDATTGGFAHMVGISGTSYFSTFNPAKTAYQPAILRSSGLTVLIGTSSGFTGSANVAIFSLTGLVVTGSITATNLSGTNTGDETTATIKTKLGLTALVNATNDTTAAAAGVAVGQLYRNGSILMIRVT